MGRLRRILGSDEDESKVEDAKASNEVEDTPEQTESSTPKVEITGKNVVVEDGSGFKIRTYSEEQHGKEFLDLAKMFISKPKNAARGFRLRK